MASLARASALPNPHSCPLRVSCNTNTTVAVMLSPSASLPGGPHHVKSSSSSPTSKSIPKMEPFNRSRISRSIREPSLIEKAEHAISDRCSILEGDDAYKCWEALFEFENLKNEYTTQCQIAASSDKQTECRPLERLENVVRQSGGVKSLIDNVRVIAKLKEMQQKSDDATVQSNYDNQSHDTASTAASESSLPFFPEPGALPPSEEELQLARSAKMPESPLTRMLRRMGNPSAWFTTDSEMGAI